MNMSDDSALILWGIDGDLRGNENHLLSAWPFVRIASDPSSVFTARGASWNLATSVAVHRLESEELAQERGTRLHAAEYVNIQPGGIVGIMGPRFLDDLSSLSIDINHNGLVWVKVQDGFVISSVQLSRWQEFTRSVSAASKALFDSEFAHFNGKGSSHKLSAALALLRGNPATKADEQIIRTAAYAKVNRDSDAFRRLVDSATDRLNCTASEVTAWVDDYIAMFSASPSRAVVSTALVPILPIQKAVIKPFDDYRFQGEPSRASVALAFKKLLAEGCHNFVNGVDERAVGDGLGQFLADQEQKPLRFDNPWFWNIWGGLTDAVEALASPRARKMHMHVLQSRIATISREVKSSLGKSLSDHIRLQSVVLSNARTVTQAAAKAEIARLRVGESQFPEERLLSSVAEDALNETDGISLDKNPISYGNLEIARGRQADFALINELLLRDVEMRRSVGIFEHDGYWGFGRRSYLLDLIENTPKRPLPRAVTELVHTILSGTESFEEEPDLSPPPLVSADDIAARCWILVDSGIPVYEESEYRIIYPQMLEKAQRLRGGELRASENRSASFEADFETFVQGTGNAFMGGSIHAQLLMRGWLRYSNRFVVLLRPHHMRAIVERPLTNRLVFGTRLQNRATLRQALQNLYLSAGGVLDRIALDAQQQGRASNGALHHLMATLSPGRPVNPEARWSFVAHEQDMIHLLRADNHFNQQPAKAPAGTRSNTGSPGKRRK